VSYRRGSTIHAEGDSFSVINDCAYEFLKLQPDSPTLQTNVYQQAKHDSTLFDGLREGISTLVGRVHLNGITDDNTERSPVWGTKKTSSSIRLRSLKH
jgi:hypothetical protein